MFDRSVIAFFRRQYCREDGSINPDKFEDAIKSYGETLAKQLEGVVLQEVAEERERKGGTS